MENSLAKYYIDRHLNSLENKIIIKFDTFSTTKENIEIGKDAFLKELTKELQVVFKGNINDEELQNFLETSTTPLFNHMIRNLFHNKEKINDNSKDGIKETYHNAQQLLKSDGETTDSTIYEIYESLTSIEDKIENTKLSSNDNNDIRSELIDLGAKVHVKFNENDVALKKDIIAKISLFEGQLNNLLIKEKEKLKNDTLKEASVANQNFKEVMSSKINLEDKSVEKQLEDTLSFGKAIEKFGSSLKEDDEEINYDMKKTFNVV